ncbi:hypothetical protein Moror_10961, partial [Moniliophthora roreri MCA 2997]
LFRSYKKGRWSWKKERERQGNRIPASTQPANITEMLETPPLHATPLPPKPTSPALTNSPETTRKLPWGLLGSLNTATTLLKTRDVVFTSISTPTPPPPTSASGLKNQHPNTPDSKSTDDVFTVLGGFLPSFPPHPLSYPFRMPSMSSLQPLRADTTTNSLLLHKLQSGYGKGGYEHDGGIVQLRRHRHRVRRPREPQYHYSGALGGFCYCRAGVTLRDTALFFFTTATAAATRKGYLQAITRVEGSREGGRAVEVQGTRIPVPLSFVSNASAVIRRRRNTRKPATSHSRPSTKVNLPSLNRIRQNLQENSPGGFPTR